jgi:hypothetical protein
LVGILETVLADIRTAWEHGVFDFELPPELD